MRTARLELTPYSVSVFAPDAECKSIVYLHASEDEAAEIYGLLRGPAVVLAAVDGVDWDGELSPWAEPRAFRGGGDFSGGAGEYLGKLTGLIIPAVESAAGAAPESRSIAGYSLAGLFAVWSAYNTDAFGRTASVSGSLWYDGFIDYMRRAQLRRPPEKAYFSLGDREKITKSPRMARVEDCTREAAEIFRASGAETEFEMNPGGHFADVCARTAKGISGIL